MRKAYSEIERGAGLHKRTNEILLNQGSASQKPAVDVQKLIHDLQTYQIELEMQNEELLHTQKKLEESRSRYSDLYDFAPIGYFTFDKSGLILEVNLTGADQLSMKRGSLKKTPFSRYLHKEDQDLFYLHCMQVLETGVRQKCGIRLNKKDGTQIYVQLDSIYVETEVSEGEQSHVIRTTVSDITDRKKMEEELQKVEKLESLGLLAGGIAHDFNNLMTGVLGNIGLAKMYAEQGKDVLDLLRDSESATLMARDLTQQLLTFSKGGAPLKKVTFINQLIRNTTSFALSGSNVKCKFSVPEDLWLSEVDASQISQVINNLVINAVQAMPRGGSIKIESENIVIEAGESLPLQEGRYIKIVVTDQGYGITKEHFQKIFDPYFTTKQKGSGLGLATAFSIVRRHDGLLTVESEVGQGTAFTIYLPASRGKPVTPVAEKQGIVMGTGKVLVMDDEEVVRKVGREILNILGYDVEFAKDGHEAIMLYEEARNSGHPFDVVIMDLTIPGGMGGKEAIEKLREIDPGVKAVVSSGYSNDPIMSDYKTHGFRSVLTKPYKVKDVSHVLQKAIMEIKD